MRVVLENDAHVGYLKDLTSTHLSCLYTNCGYICHGHQPCWLNCLLFSVIPCAFLTISSRSTSSVGFPQHSITFMTTIQMQSCNASMASLLSVRKSSSCSDNSKHDGRVLSSYPTMLCCFFLQVVNGFIELLNRHTFPSDLSCRCCNTVRAPTGSFLIPSGLDPHTEQCLFVGQLDEIACEPPP